MKYEHDETIENSVRATRYGILGSIFLIILVAPVLYFAARLLAPVTARRALPMLMVLVLPLIIFFALPESYLLCSVRSDPDVPCSFAATETDAAAMISHALIGAGSDGVPATTLAYLKVLTLLVISIGSMWWLIRAAQYRSEKLLKREPGWRRFWNQSIPPVMFYLIGSLNILVLLIPFVGGLIPAVVVSHEYSKVPGSEHEYRRDATKPIYLSFQTLSAHLEEKREKAENDLRPMVQEWIEDAKPVSLAVVNVNGTAMIDFSPLRDENGYFEPGFHSVVAVFKSEIPFFPNLIAPNAKSLAGVAGVIPGKGVYKDGELLVPMLIDVTERDRQKLRAWKESFGEIRLSYRVDVMQYLGIAASINNALIQNGLISKSPLRIESPTAHQQN